MPGLYFHIPFCKQACHYCNFHFSTSMGQRGSVLSAMLKELEWRQDYLADKAIDSIYFGGGTPSLLEASELGAFFEQATRYFRLLPSAEITLEANPDDLSKDKLAMLRDSPVNRLSIGVQSFSETDLRFFNRAHNAREARASLEQALAAGFKDLTIDLIYGSPTTTDEQWAESLKIAIGYGIPHLSCYALTVEPSTALAHFVKHGKSEPVSEEQAARHFDMLLSATESAGYEQYEISNFALPGHYARHNSNYWRGAHYLGIGPSAHSYNGTSRQWNVANNTKYLRAMEADSPSADWAAALYECEQLRPEDQYNEYVMTRLRTVWGVQLEALSALNPAFEQHFLERAKPYLENGQLIRNQATFRLTKTGRFLADGIAAALFW